MLTVSLGERFDVVVCAFNLIYCLSDQTEQVELLHNAARHLEPRGTLVTETQTINLSDFTGNRIVGPTHLGADRAELVMSMHDPVHQLLDRTVVDFSDGGVQTSYMRFRYVWPAELDLMAQLAGLRLRGRFGGWSGEPYTATSPHCISLFEHNQPIG